MKAAINLDRMVIAYNAIRDCRTVKRHAWEAVDPLVLLGEYLTRRSLVSASAIEEMEHRIAVEIEAAFEYALASPNPTEEDLYRHVYAD